MEKGNYLVTIYSDSITDGIKNTFLLKPIPTVSQNQASGETTLVADLLRIIRTFLIKGYITPSSTTDTYPAKLNGVAQNLTATQVKGYLVKICTGAETTGGAVTLTYSEGGDTTSFNVFIESCLITQESADEPASPSNDFAKFNVTLTAIKGTKMSGS